MDELGQENLEATKRARFRTGVESRITFETKIHENNFSELMGNQHVNLDSDDLLGKAFTLAKVSYTANLTDWCSMIAIPMGARCRDMPISTVCSLQVCGINLNDCSIMLYVVIVFDFAIFN